MSEAQFLLQQQSS